MKSIQKDIIERINKGDTKAFAQLYTCFYTYLCAVAIKYVYNTEIAKEIVNDVFIAIWNNRGALSFPIKAYLIKITQNRCLNYLRKQRLELISLSDAQEQLLLLQERITTQDPHPLSQLENKEFRQSIAKAVDKLPEKCREIFIQHIYFDKSYEEIARTKKISASTVRVQMKIGLAKLKEILLNISCFIGFILK